MIGRDPWRKNLDFEKFDFFTRDMGQSGPSNASKSKLPTMEHEYHQILRKKIMQTPPRAVAIWQF